MFNLKSVYTIVFTSLAAWSLFAYFTTTEIITSQQEYAYIINITGKQRMLSQKTALISKRYYEENTQDLKMHLLELKTLMKKDHEHIIKDYVKSDKLISLYLNKPKSLNVKVILYLELLSDFLEIHNESALKNIVEQSFYLLPLLNEAVSVFEAESNEKTELLMQRELFILIGTLLTLLLEAIFIVMPALKIALRHESELNRLIEERTHELEELSITDQLTKLYNRRHIDKTLSSELDKARRYDDLFSLILLDIDYFKNVNDTYGHQVGDAILKSIAKLLTDNVRKTDMVGRWGGEEFLIITTDNDSKKVLHFAEKLRSVIETHKFNAVKKVTCSFGVTHYMKDDTDSSIIGRADDALYEAKASGRNCVKESIVSKILSK